MSTSPSTPTPARSGSGPLVTPQGVTTISDAVVSKIAGIAAREVRGVHALGGGAARAVGALRERIPGATTNRGQGVSVEVGERQAAVDIDLVVAYGVPLADVVAGVRRSVISNVERMTGLQVTAVDVEVTDVHIPSDDEDGEDADRRPRVL